MQPTARKSVDNAFQFPPPATGTPPLRLSPEVEAGDFLEDDIGPNPAQAGRYHLLVSHACPFSHRTLLAHVLKGLEGQVGIHYLNAQLEPRSGCRAVMGAKGERGRGKDPLAALHVLQADILPLPILWDRRHSKVVTNRSLQIILFFDRTSWEHSKTAIDLFPAGQEVEIRKFCRYVNLHLCRAVYRAGFAQTQADYERKTHSLFETLERLECRMADGRHFLFGNVLTAADILVFPTLARFDIAYFGALRCNLRRLADYPRLSAHTARCYALPKVTDTLRFDQIRRYYYRAAARIDHAITPLGPPVDFLEVFE